jgi:hypothetical protein
MSDSEDESPTMTVIEKKTKKPRSEAQKKATAKALEILNQRRAEKWKLKQAELEAREQVQKEVMIEEAKADERKKLESRKKPVHPVAKPVEHNDQNPSDTADFLAVLSDLRDEVKSLHKKVAHKPKKVRVIEEESEEEEEVVVKKKKAVKTPTPEPPPPGPAAASSSNLRSLFFRNQ